MFIVNDKQHFVTDVMCYVTSAKGLTLVVSMQLYHAEIIYEQNASKIVQMSQQIAKLCQK